MQKVFVYGTLRKGSVRNHVLKDQEFLGEAKSLPEFSMMDLGAFPGLVATGKTVITGELYNVSDACLGDLDMIEGACLEYPEEGLYRRHYINLADGTKNVLVYLYNGGLNSRRVIDSGDWVAYEQGC